MNIFTYNTFLGPLSIVANDNYITHVFFNHKFKLSNARNFESTLIKKAYLQICEYFDGQRNTFEVPITLFETEFGEKIRKVIEGIPYGKSLTYKCICDSIGQPKVWRAVGQSVRANRIAILIPYHRVLGVSDKTNGHEDDLKINLELLKLENKYLNLFN